MNRALLLLPLLAFGCSTVSKPVAQIGGAAGLVTLGGC